MYITSLLNKSKMFRHSSSNGGSIHHMKTKITSSCGYNRSLIHNNKRLLLHIRHDSVLISSSCCDQDWINNNNRNNKRILSTKSLDCHKAKLIGQHHSNVSLSSLTITRRILNASSNNDNSRQKRRYHDLRRDRNINNRYYSSSTIFHDNNNDNNNTNNKVRIAIVGGGCAGLSVAIHLAELVELGYIDGPIDIYENYQSQHGRDIGIGLWSTSIESFDIYHNQNNRRRSSYEYIYNEITKIKSTFITNVGYRIPNGNWLMKSQLPSSMNNESNQSISSSTVPSLLFLSEKDLLNTLQNAIDIEQHNGNVQMISNKEGVYVTSLQEEYDTIQALKLPYSTRLVMNDSSLSDRDYNIIIATDGTYSTLRQKFGGYGDLSLMNHPSNVAAISRGGGGGFGGIQQQEQPNINNNSNINSNNNNVFLSNHGEISSFDRNTYETIRQNEINVQDRHYTVFRGNAIISIDEMKQYDNTNNPDNTLSFQTWGETNNMRFATVPMEQNINHNEEQHIQVWFITIDNDNIINELDPTKRRDMLLYEFRNWHDPIKQILLSTLPNEILMERAVAHKRNVSPITSFYHVIQQYKKQSQMKSSILSSASSTQKETSSSSSHINIDHNDYHGPCLLFHGDAYFTLDPILAQGYTTAMEGSYSIRLSLEKALKDSSKKHKNNDEQQQSSLSDSNIRISIDQQSNDNNDLSLLSKRMEYIRYELKVRHQQRIDRLHSVIQITELVQALGQQQSNNTFISWCNINILRPIIQMIPNIIKQPIFNEVMKYSLGLGIFHRPKQQIKT